MRPLLIIVYDLGAAGPADLVAAARDVCDVVFVADPRSRHVADNLAVLRAAAPVVEAPPDPRAVADAVKVLRPAGVTTFSESRIGLTAAVADLLGLPYHAPATAAALADKAAQREALARAGVPSARHRAIAGREGFLDAVAAVGLPAVLKPRQGAGSVDVRRLDTLQDCTRAANDLGAGYVLEELLVGDPTAAGPGFGDYVSVESVVHDGEIRHVAVTGKFPLAAGFRETGQFLPATLAPALADRVTATAGHALRALDVRDGVTHTELKLTPSGPRIIEVNGRAGGYVSDLLRRCTGYDLLGAAMRSAVGRAPETTVGPPRQVAFRRYLAAPPGRVVLTALDGPDRVAALPGVTHVEIRAGIGQVLDSRNGTQDCLGVVYGRATDHDALRRLVEEMDALVDARYEHVSAPLQPTGV
ncbi:hypothetical protein Val02_52530 [Virgisporangium aliadipatigenens]|uniref:ATP-grasp domain-containing protein n=1 Tax=Virgisporangium aliadipatigenens TaxID=741659 RepID=A0A8J3YQ14_9ACTN|nr:hypothetical protein [Virgisporangium aliadipatigenens]GIJ48367.1 hypothetical protein Val02_52530 [Virgisporangium aliadipatigenens]